MKKAKIVVALFFLIQGWGGAQTTKPKVGMDSTVWGPATVAGDNGKSYSVLGLENQTRGRKVVRLTFNKSADLGIGRPKFAVKLNASLLAPDYSFPITLEPGGNRFEIRSDTNPELQVAWLSISGTSQDGNTLTGVTGLLRRFVDGKEYASDLSTWGNIFEFPLEESLTTATAVAILKDTGAVYGFSEVTVDMVSANGTILASRKYPVFADMVQVTVWAWQLFVSSVEEWRALLGGEPKGYTLRFFSSGWPIVATSAKVPIKSPPSPD